MDCPLDLISRLCFASLLVLVLVGLFSNAFGAF